MYKTKKFNNEELKNHEDKKIVYNFIITVLAAIVLLIESIYILMSGLKTGILKKEILTTRSDIGFDIIIKTN